MCPTEAAVWAAGSVHRSSMFYWFCAHLEEQDSMCTRDEIRKPKGKPWDVRELIYCGYIE